MHDQVGVRVRHRAQDVEHQPKPGLGRQTSLVAVMVDTSAGDVLEHEIGQTALGHARVEQSGDVDMIQPGEKGSLPAKAPGPYGVEQREVEELDSGRGLVATVAAATEPDGAHASFPQQPLEGVGAQTQAGQPGQAGAFPAPCGVQQEARSVQLGLRGEQPLEFPGAFGAADTQAGEECLTLGRLEFESLLEQRSERRNFGGRTVHGSSTWRASDGTSTADNIRPAHASRHAAS